MKAVQDVRDGRVDLDLRATVSAALPFVGSVAVASILASIGIAIGFILIIVPGLILLTFWSLIVPEIVIGGAGALESFGRSWRTVRGYAWNVFGTFILVFLILIAAQIVLSAGPARPALRLAQLHRRPGVRRAGGAVPRRGRDADLLPAHRRARRAGRAGRRLRRAVRGIAGAAFVRPPPARRYGPPPAGRRTAAARSSRRSPEPPATGRRRREPPQYRATPPGGGGGFALVTTAGAGPARR